MRFSRGAWRVLASCVITLMGLCGVLSAGPRARLSGQSPHKLRAAHMQRWARRLARALRMRVEVAGTPPEPPFFLVSNHLSYMDIILIGTQIECFYVAKSDIASWPLIGTVTRAAGTLFVDRATKKDIPRALAAIRKTLEQEVGIVLFPEGTSSNGETILPFKSSLLEVAACSEAPVYYATVSYDTPRGEESARDTVCWWGDAGFVGHFLRIVQLPEFEGRLEFGPEAIREQNRKMLADRLWRAAAGQFRPVT